MANGGWRPPDRPTWARLVGSGGGADFQILIGGLSALRDSIPMILDVLKTSKREVSNGWRKVSNGWRQTSSRLAAGQTEERKMMKNHDFQQKIIFGFFFLDRSAHPDTDNY